MTPTKYPHEALLDDLHKNFVVYLCCILLFIGGWMAHYSLFHEMEDNPWILLQGIIAVLLGVLWLREELKERESRDE